MSERDKIQLFKIMIFEYFNRKSSDLETDRSHILYNISFHHLDSDRYYDLIVNDIRNDYLRSLSREIFSIIDTYLSDWRKIIKINILGHSGQWKISPPEGLN